MIVGDVRRCPPTHFHATDVACEIGENVMADANSNPRHSVNSSQQFEYHLAEFAALKSEISDLIKQTTTYLTYAITLSGFIIAWLFSVEHAQKTVTQAQWLPIIISSMFGLLSAASYIRIGEKSRYIRKLEVRFASGLGWEHDPNSRPGKLFWLYVATWGILNSCNLILVPNLGFPVR
jgi:hypothetical protein